MKLSQILVALLSLDADGVLNSTPAFVDLGEFVIELITLVLEGLHSVF